MTLPPPTRLPRRYSNDKSRDTSTPIVGTSGSTPLHFAAANGNLQVVIALLHHGAHADRPDKYGITPQMLSIQHGWLECAQVLQDWVENKDRDLREKEDMKGTTAALDVEPTRRRLHVKQSIDTALNMLKSSSTGLSDAYFKHPHSAISHARPSIPVPLASAKTAEDQTVRTLPLTGDVNHPGSYPPGLDPRRPSLPQVLGPATPHSGTLPVRNRKVSAPVPQYCSSPTRRPRSAGTGADKESEFDQSANGRKRLGTKYSLLNLFKKGQPDESSSEPSISSESSPPLPPPSHGASKPLESLPIHHFPATHEKNSPGALTPLSTSISFPRAPFRFHRGSDASTHSRNVASQPQPKFTPASGSPSRPPIALAVDLHNALQHQQTHTFAMRDRSRSNRSIDSFGFDADSVTSGSPSMSSPLSRFNLLRNRGHRRDRSGSSGSLGNPLCPSPSHRNGAVFEDDVVVVPGSKFTNGEIGDGSMRARPGILRTHNRIDSAGQSLPSSTVVPLQQQLSTGQRLRFESSTSLGQRREDDVVRLGPSNNHGALIRDDIPGSVGRAVKELPRVPESAPASIEDLVPLSGLPSKHLEGYDEEEAEDYGQPLERSEYDVSSSRSALMSTQLTVANLPRPSSSQSSLSPIDTGTNSVDALKGDFPFNLRQPPADEALQEHLLVPPAHGLRASDSPARPSISIGGTSASSAGPQTPRSEVSSQDSPPSILPKGRLGDERVQLINKEPASALATSPRSKTSLGLNERRSHFPLDINISAISTHAQAEALVQRAQQDIFEMAQLIEEPVASGGSNGRTPLSSKLAAYGETLALERKLREAEEASAYRVLTKKSSVEALGAIGRKPSNIMLTQERSPGRPFPSPLPPASLLDSGNRRGGASGVERQQSLGHRSGMIMVTPRSSKGPKRPSTADACK